MRMENFRACLSKFIATFVAFVFMTFGARAADTNTPQFLFLIDHSPDMAPRQLATVETVYNLVRTGFYNRIEPGEHFGLWFYGSTLQTNDLFTWDPARNMELARDAANLFTGRIYSKLRPREETLRDVAPFLARSSRLIIFIITDGYQPLAGTPFDAAINNAIPPHRLNFARAAKPFVITLVAKNGEWVSGNVHTNVNAPFELAATAPNNELVDAALTAIRAANTVPPPTRAATPTPKPTAAAEIDKARAALRDALSGNAKPASAPAPARVEPKAETKTVAVLPPVEEPKEQAKPEPKEQPKAEVKEPAKEEAKPEQKPPVEQPAPTPPKPVEVAAVTQEPAPIEKRIETPPSEPKPTEPKPQTILREQPKANSEPPVVTANQTPTTTAPTQAPVSTPRTESRPVAIENSKSVEPTAPVPKPQLTTEPAPKSASQPAPAPRQTAAVTPRRGFPWPVLVGGFFAIALGGAVALMRARTRAKSPGSLITQTMPRSGSPRSK